MTNVGITSYGAYIPWYRMSRKVISTALGPLCGGSAPGEKAVANFDEDSITMAYAACHECLTGIDRQSINGILFATTTAPYRERESASIIATALNLKTDIRSADVSDSLKAGTGSILFACDSVKAQGKGNILVASADCRLGKPGSPEEIILGDAAASVLIGTENVIASLEGFYTCSYDFPDYRRLPDDKFVRSTEDRFIREEGYAKIVPEAVNGLLEKYKLNTKDVSRIAYPCSNIREHAAIGKKMGFNPEQIKEPLIITLGEAGAASPLLLLISILEEAQPGDNIIITSYGNGAEALLLKVTEEIKNLKNREIFKKCINTNQKLTSYEKYLAIRGILPLSGFDGAVTPTTQLPLAWRERKTILALIGTRCKNCGTPQYPPQRICVNPECGHTDEMEPYCFADKRAKLFSYTEDHVSKTISPPLLYGIVDFEGGGRFPFDLTDCEAGTVKTGMQVDMTLRRKYMDDMRGIIGYSWKARPSR